MNIKIYSGKICYELNLQYKLTIVRGDSGTGKSNLLGLLASKLVHIESEYSVRFYHNGNIEDILDTLQGLDMHDPQTRIIFIDEEVDGILSRRFQKYVNTSKHLWVMFSRSDLPGFATPIQAVGEFKSINGKYKFEPYSCIQEIPARPIKHCYTEDSKSLDNSKLVATKTNIFSQ